MATTNPIHSQTKTAPSVKKSILEKLIKNYQKRVKLLRKSSGKVEDYDPARDSKSIWFSKKDLNHLFEVNGCSDDDGGLRIYFAVHDSTEMETPYDDKLTVVLVATKLINGVVTDQLHDGLGLSPATASMAAAEPADGPGDGTDDGSGQGLNHGKICPPDICP